MTTEYQGYEIEIEKRPKNYLVVFDDEDIEGLKHGELVENEGYKFRYVKYNNVEYNNLGGRILTDNTIERLRSGEGAVWGGVTAVHEDYVYSYPDGSPGPASEATTVPEILSDTAETFENKNDDYGNSWQKIGAIKRLIAHDEGPEIVELEDGREAVVLADVPDCNSTFEQNFEDAVTRQLDKIIRKYNLIRLVDEPKVEDESALDACTDDVGYAAMIASLVAKQ